MPFQIVRNDITQMHVDAIVNTANPMPGYGSGLDCAVYEAAGAEALLARRHEIGPIEPGCSVITDGYNLPAGHIIHTVGTAWCGGKYGEEDVIRKCYKSVFKVALENGIGSLAIPLLASGCYGFPKGIALRIALSEIEEFMSEHDMELFLVVFDEKSVSLSEEFYGDIDEYINDNYVEEKSQMEYSDMTAFSERRAAERPGASHGFSFRGGLFSRSGQRVLRSEATDAEDDIVDAESEDLECAAESVAPARTRSLEDVIGNLDKTFMELVFSFADERGLSDVEVQKKANLDRKAFSKLKCGTTKNPSKSTALALAVALSLNLDETKDLLSRAGLALSPCSKQDVIVQYFIEREAYDIYEINIALFEHGEQPLGMQTA